MKGLFNKIRGKRGADANEVHATLDDEILLVSSELREKYMLLQKEVLREAISKQLASLRDEVNVEKILADLGEDYLLRRDFDSALLQTNVDLDPVLILRFSKQRRGLVETTDRWVPLTNYATI